MFKVGHKVRCVSNFDETITFGKIYEVIETNYMKFNADYFIGLDNQIVTIRDDFGYLNDKYSYKFEKVEDNMGNGIKVSGEGIDINNGEITIDKEGTLTIKKSIEKNFREVIRDIKQGEVWESDRKIITINEKLNITVIEKVVGKQMNFLFSDSARYKLQRKQYNFAEAFATYEEGKEIESCKSNVRFKKINGVDCFYNSREKDFTQVDTFIEFNEIRGKWYVND